MKKSISLSVVLISALIFSACSDNTRDETPSGASYDNGEITYYDENGKEVDGFVECGYSVNNGQKLTIEEVKKVLKDSADELAKLGIVNDSCPTYRSFNISENEVELRASNSTGYMKINNVSLNTSTGYNMIQENMHKFNKIVCSIQNNNSEFLLTDKTVSTLFQKETDINTTLYFEYFSTKYNAQEISSNTFTCSTFYNGIYQETLGVTEVE